MLISVATIIRGRRNFTTRREILIIILQVAVCHEISLNAVSVHHIFDADEQSRVSGVIAVHTD